MKKSILFFLSIPVFFCFVDAYNCSTIYDRIAANNKVWEQVNYEWNVLVARREYVSSSYEAANLLADFEEREIKSDKRKAESDILVKEESRCSEQWEIYNWYLDKWDKAKKELIELEDYDEDLVNTALKWYQKAYDLAYEAKFKNYENMRKSLKKDIDALTEYKEDQQTRIKNAKEWDKLPEQYKEALEYGQKWDYDNAIKILEKILKNEWKIEWWTNYDLAREVLWTYKEWKKILEEWEKSYQETWKIPTEGSESNLPELNQAILWMYEKWLTIFNEPVSFNAYNWLRRDEAAKFFVKYAKEVMGMIPDYSKQWCSFKDLNQAWSDLKDVIVESCQLWLFQWNKWKFMPTQQLTNAQAITVFMRLREWYKDESWTHFANNYYESAHAQWLLYDTPLDNKIYFDNYTTRWDVAKMLFRWQKTN